MLIGLDQKIVAVGSVSEEKAIRRNERRRHERIVAPELYLVLSLRYTIRCGVTRDIVQEVIELKFKRIRVTAVVKDFVHEQYCWSKT